MATKLTGLDCGLISLMVQAGHKAMFLPANIRDLCLIESNKPRICENKTKSVRQVEDLQTQ